MEYRTVGLDFGTHQTKICVQIVPDEGRGQAHYEFFTFGGDEEGTGNYFLPSTVVLQSDNTLRYGCKLSNQEQVEAKPRKRPLSVAKKVALDVGTKAKELFSKYVGKEDRIKGMTALTRMLAIRKKQMEQKEEEQVLNTEEDPQIEAQTVETFQYFKQAVFTGSSWNHKLSSKEISILYISYVLFLLEERYEQNFTINMGVPADSNNYEQKKQLAVEILLNAYELVENVYANDKERFLRSTISELQQNMPSIRYSKEKQEEYYIKVFPEAYAGLTTLTSQRLLGNNMCLYVDIGGGTTDFSFFTVGRHEDKLDRTPQIYLYWSIPRGLNYLAEASGFDYFQQSFNQHVKPEVVNAYHGELTRNANKLEGQLFDQLHLKSDVRDEFLSDKLSKGIVVYNGGGSTYRILTHAVGKFSDYKIVDSKLWNHVEIKEKETLTSICPLLTTAFGLSLSEKESDVKLTPFSSLFEGLVRYKEPGTNGYDNEENEDRTPRGKWV